MRTRAISIVLVLFIQMLKSGCVTVKLVSTNDLIINKSRIVLPPFLVTCKLMDVVIISAPIVNNSNTLYYLNKPNGDVIRLEINPWKKYKTQEFKEKNKTKKMEESYKDYYKNIMVSRQNQYRIVKLDKNPTKDFKESNDILVEDNDEVDDFDEIEIGIDDFAVGPLIEEDHGNWILSVYFIDNNKDWTEAFQVISLEIVESVPIVPQTSNLSRGDTLELSFAYPIKNLETCQLVAPESSFDRYYDRDRSKLNYCGFLVQNVTKEDEGLWKIVGVGKIVYVAQMYFKITVK